MKGKGKRKENQHAFQTFMCLNALIEQDGLVAMHGTYVYPAKRSRAAFLETNARLFAQLEKYATVVNKFPSHVIGQLPIFWRKQVIGRCFTV